jgi:coenzyme F420-reducing hydrogenase alpha subunit
MGVKVSDQTDKLRILCHYGEQMESHILHVGYLVAPDLLGQKSVIPLVASHPDVVKTIIRLHRLGNTWMEIIGGRMTHPVSLKVGGFTMLPTEEKLRELKTMMENAVPDLKTLAEVLLSLADKLPDFDRETEYIALTGPDYYTFYHGDIASTDTDEIVPVQEFERVANEYVVPQSTAKWTKWHRDSYAVGALARFNVNADKLMPLAAETAKSFGLKKGACNPYLNNIAQVVECVQVVEHGLQLIDELLTAGITPEPVKIEQRPAKASDASRPREASSSTATPSMIKAIATRRISASRRDKTTEISRRTSRRSPRRLSIGLRTRLPCSWKCWSVRTIHVFPARRTT